MEQTDITDTEHFIAAKYGENRISFRPHFYFGDMNQEIKLFNHLKDVLVIAEKSDDLPLFLKERKPIIVTTQQKFAWVLEEIQKNSDLKKLLVAFLIDEAHRSQQGQMGAAIRLPFHKEGEHDLNQLFVASTATPAPATVTMFGKPFDSYTEAEAIAEDYIVDVAASIISYKTLYNLDCPIVPQPDEEKLYPKGVVSKALQNVAFQDDGLIQYKAEVMLRFFEKDVKPLIGRTRQGDDRDLVSSSGMAIFQYHQGKAQGARGRLQGALCLFGFRPIPS